MDLATMALAFARQKPFTGAVLMAASHVAQLESNLKSLDVTPRTRVDPPGRGP
jgi:aryl-alcohol dehydrogenase-like predicted oxidoreductase